MYNYWSELTATAAKERRNMTRTDKLDSAAKWNYWNEGAVAAPSCRMVDIMDCYAEARANDYNYY